MEIIITTIIGLLTGGIGAAIVNGIFAMRKNKAESEKTKSDTNRVSSDAWKEFAEKMEKRQEALDAELVKTRSEAKQDREELNKTKRTLNRWGKRIVYLTNGIEILVNQIIEEGKQPCWSPDEWNPDQEEVN